ncbi:exported protein of unknown function [Xenorhabdus poinarii G6]|uniref:Uncharacterized protein n=1 Tax=Xenorhabdus poinarii G6 TaxID=1354304 RepID=A0A068R092_9GAMM|nr:hypothetical protein [Xenorhabdus poinarii]CDG20697.1 exported protein of unknown function [Xenorhabdus poinarii G6]
MKKQNVFLIMLLAIFLYFGAFNTKDDTYQKIMDAAPAREQQFIGIVDGFVKETKSANNDMQIAALKTKRVSTICHFFRGNLKVSGWSGKVIDLNSNNDGKGVIVISLTKDIRIRTWNNAFSDSGDDTLINQGTVLFEKALSLKKGQLVSFSGSFIPDRDECVREVSVTQNGSMEDPEFLFRFSDISSLASH